MPSTKKFSALKDHAMADPARAERINAGTTAALRDHAEYQLG